MKYKKALVRSAVIISILLLSVLTGFLFQFIWDKVDRANYPRDYSEYVEQYAGQYGVPEAVVYAVIKTESSFSSGAVSDAGAVGLMQIMPDTFNWLMTMTKESLEEGMLYDPATNIKYGTYYLSYLYLRYNSWDEVFAAYNAGHGNVDEWLEDEQYTDKDGKLSRIPFEETKNYVKKVNNAIDVYKRLYYES
ncbi:MAG: lytic transglycosylase domain-containing protein [Clostridiales bacterium]|nr:lytic transglycosylase domain-containing protein [Clostridiales bacterium]